MTNLPQEAYIYKPDSVSIVVLGTTLIWFRAGGVSSGR